MSLSRRPALLAAAYLCLIGTWIFSNPPGGSPDEGAHYLKALAAGRGDFVLEKRPPPLDSGAPAPASMRWMHRQARLVAVPAQLTPDVFGCRGQPGRLEPCTSQPPVDRQQVEISTYVATYPPAPYVIPGLLMKAAGSTHEAVYLGRAGSAILSALFLTLAVVVLWDKRHPLLSLLGVGVGITPMVVFVASSLSGSGPEAAAAIALLAGLLRLTRQGERRHNGEQHRRSEDTRLPWAVAGFSGAVLAATRDLGLAWAAVLPLIFVGWVGFRRARLLFRSGGSIARAAGVLFLLSITAGLIWQLLVQVRPPVDPGDLLDQVTPSPALFREITRQQIGVFGPLDTVMPLVVYRAWWLFAFALVVTALALADARRRLVIIGTLAVATAAIPLVDAAQRLVGFGAQGRHLLPLSLAVVLVAAETVFQGASRAPKTSIALAVSGFSLAATVQLVAWHTLARRYTVGPDGPVLFLKEAVWVPPAGWIVWSLLAVTGAGLILAYALLNLPAQARVMHSSAR